jgi:hypothetical protein
MELEVTKMVQTIWFFRFSGFGGGDGANVSADRTSTTDLDGLHVATFNPKGYLYVSENYFNLKTINIYLHKDGIQKDIKRKLGLK